MSVVVSQRQSRKKAKESALNALKSDCSALKSASECKKVCESKGQSYTGYGIWGSVNYTVLSTEKGSDCGWVKTVKATGSCCCACYSP
jgi:hypothetical protein